MDDLTGRRFGKLVVISENGTRKRKKCGLERLWLCKCDCGKETVVSTNKLTTGHTKSCGCMRGCKAKDDLIGMKFNQLTVIEWIPPEKRKSKLNSLKCRCDCGNETEVNRYKLTSGHTKSCGCHRLKVLKTSSIKYKNHDRRLYEVYMAIKYRCTNPNNPRYHNYGGRNITMCNEWLESFDNFAEWAYANGYDSNAEHGECTIDRKENEKGYCPENCRWITNKEQQSNRRDNINITFLGETHNMKEWSDILNIPYSFMNWRMSLSPNKRTMEECIREYQEYLDKKR